MRQSRSDDFDAILAEHGSHVWRLIVRTLGDDGHDAADCFQQAFVELVSRQQQLRDVRDPGGLLRRIAARRAIDVVRRRIRDRNSTETVDEARIPTIKEPGPAERAEAAELIRDLRSALTEIPERQSTTFVLIEFENMSREEVSSAIGVTINHVGVLLFRARAALREHLESHQPLREARP